MYAFNLGGILENLKVYLKDFINIQLKIIEMPWSHDSHTYFRISD